MDKLVIIYVDFIHAINFSGRPIYRYNENTYIDRAVSFIVLIYWFVAETTKDPVFLAAILRH